MNKNEITPVQIAIRIVIIIILIVVLILVSFAMVRLVPKVFSSLSSLRGFFTGLFPSKENLNVSLDKQTVQIGESANLTFKKTGGTTNGIYTITYSCSKISSTTHLQVNDVTNQVMNCANPLYIGDANATNTEKVLSIVPTGTPISYDQPMEITVAHVNGSTTLSSAVIVLNIKGQTIAESVATTTPRTAAPTTKTNTVVNSGVKTVAPSTNYRSSAPANLNLTIVGATINRDIARGTITFNVTNVGGRPSGAWRLNAVVPRSAGQTSYDSGYQSSIPAGGTSIMTLAFDNAQTGNIVITLYGFGDQKTFYFNANN